MKCVMLATRPKWCEKICNEIGKNENGTPIYEKTIEVRKTKPSVPTPFKVFIYETYDKKYDGIGICWGKGKCFEHGCRKVIGEFICDKVTELDYVYYWNNGYEIDTCLTYREVADYGKGKPLYGWHITDLKIYDKPKELSEFYIRCRISDKKCRLCDNCFSREDSYGRYYTVKKLTRPPMSWCYVQE